MNKNLNNKGSENKRKFDSSVSYKEKDQMSSKRKKFNNSYETNNKIKNKIGNGNRNRNRNSNRNRNRYGSMEKILSSLVMEMEDNDESEKNKILAQQIEAFKQEFDEDDYDNDYEGDRSNYNINEDFNKNQNTKKSRRLTLEFFLKLNIKKELSLKKKSIKNDMYNGKGDKATFKCPYCKYEYYDKIEESVHQELQHFLEVNHMKKDGKIISFNIPVMKQYEYCRLHQAKLVIIPQGLKKGYPLEINFDLLQERIERFKKDLFEIVYDRKKSYFRELALNEYKRYGSNKARNFSFLIQRFDKILVGYYGSKGFNIITEILLNMFFIKRKENELAVITSESENEIMSETDTGVATATTSSTSTSTSISTSISTSNIHEEESKSITEYALPMATSNSISTSTSSSTSISTCSSITNHNSSSFASSSSSSFSLNNNNNYNINNINNNNNINSNTITNTNTNINKNNDVNRNNTNKNDNNDNNDDNEFKNENLKTIRYNTVVKTEKILTFELTRPQKPFEYIQEVLVPECGVRLIAEDQHLNIDNKEDMEKARKIMEESNEFGLVVHEF